VQWERFSRSAFEALAPPAGQGLSEAALKAAAAAGHTEIVRALLEAGAAPDEAKPFEGTALAAAVRYGHRATVLALLDAGAAREPPRGTPVLIAAIQGLQLEMVRLLSELGVSRPSRELAMEVLAFVRRREGRQPSARQVLDDIERLLRGLPELRAAS
jgi:ankyrin repeat protein